MSMQAVERYPDWTPQDRIRYFFGVVTPIAPMWYLMTLVGALVGSAIPAGFALNFAVPITFLAMIAPMLRTFAHIAAAFVAVVLSLTLTFVPFNLGLILAGFGGMITGAFVELMIEHSKQIKETAEANSHD
jgi:predicted branched-subunit amino acid permease